MKIDKIEVTENDKYFIIFAKEKKIFIDNTYLSISDEKINDFIRIIRNWDKEYKDLSYLDGNIFDIKIYYDGKIDEIKGIRGYPPNYEEFSNFIRSIYDGR